MREVAEYFRGLGQYIAKSWNRFWFEPSDAFDLCVMRILVALLGLGWLISYSPDLVSWFGTGGLLSTESVSRIVSTEQASASLYRWSFLDWLREPWQLWTAHLLGALVFIGMLVGLRSRVAAFLAWIVVLSYLHRGPLVVGISDLVLSMLLAYLWLAPIGRYLSLDSRWQRARLETLPVEHWSSTVVRRLLQVHLVIFYFVMGTTKLAGVTWWHGEAVWWMSAQPDSRLFDWTFLRDNPVLLNVWTLSILMGELLFGILIWNRWLRPLVLVISAILWLSLGVVSGNLALSVTMLIANSVFIPAEFWRRLLSRQAASV